MLFLREHPISHFQNRLNADPSIFFFLIHLSGGSICNILEKCIFILCCITLSPSIAISCTEVWSFVNMFLMLHPWNFMQSNVTFVGCSSYSHTWDAFQLAHASFRLYCVRNNHVLPDNSQKVSGKLAPRLLGGAPKINITPAEKDMGEEEEGSSEALPAIKIYDEDVDVRFLVCGLPCTVVSLSFDNYSLSLPPSPPTSCILAYSISIS